MVQFGIVSSSKVVCCAIFGGGGVEVSRDVVVVEGVMAKRALGSKQCPGLAGTTRSPSHVTLRFLSSAKMETLADDMTSRLPSCNYSRCSSLTTDIAVIISLHCYLF